MKVTILQTDIAWAQPELNEQNAGHLILNAPKADLYILPEMWNTGFVTDMHSLAAGSNGRDLAGSAVRSLEWMRSTAQRHQCAICGSMAVRTGNGNLFNRLYFALPDNTVFHYDKHHLFKYGGEDLCFTPGNERTVAVYKGMRFLLVTCYDLRFPTWMRYRGDYDAIIVVANWPASRNNAWNILLRARAIENQCYVLAANRTGTDINCTYMGNSAIIDAYGNTLAQAQGQHQQAVTADISAEKLAIFRNKFNVLEDRDM